MKVSFASVLLGCLLLVAALGAQSIQLTGRVVDAHSKKGLAGADVYLVSGRAGTTTDARGNFSLAVTAADLRDTLVIRFLGYREVKIPVVQFENGARLELTPRPLDIGEKIEVMGEKIDLTRQEVPHARNLIRFKEIQDYGSSEIVDILKPMPAVRISGNDLDGRRIEIRGSNPDEVNVYLDGILINNLRFDNSADLSIIPVENIARLELLKGGNFSLLGSGAFGGVVNIVTRQNLQRSVYLKGKAGSFDTRYLIGELNLPLSRKFVVNYFGQFNRLSPEIEYFPGEQYSDKTTARGISTRKQNHHLHLSYFSKSAQWNSRFIGYFFDYRKPGWRNNDRNYLAALSFKGALAGIRDLEFMVNNFFTNDELDRLAAGTTHFISTYNASRLNVRLAKKLTYRTVEIQLLSEYFHEELLSDSRSRSGEQDVPLYHAFLYDNRASAAAVVSFRDQWRENPAVSWKTYLGLRGDFLASGQQDVTHTVGLQVNYKKGFWEYSPYFNYGKNVKYPTLLEAAYVRDLVDFSHRDSTAGRLEPEYNNSVDVGINMVYAPPEARFRQLKMSVSLFSRTVYNKLLKRPFDNVLANFQLGRDVTRGVEASVKLNDLFRLLTVQLAYIKLNISDPLLYAYKPDENFSFHLSGQTPAGFYFTGTFFREGTSVAWFYDTQNQIQTREIEPFFDADLSLGWRFRLLGATLDLQAAGYNVFDNSGFRYYYLKKRYLQVSLGIRY